MPDRPWKRLLVVAGVGLAVVLASPLIGERVALLQLGDRGFVWNSIHRSRAAWGIDGVYGRGIRIAHLRIPWEWPLEVTLSGVDVDLEKVRSGVGGGGTGEERISFPLILEDVTLRLGDWVLGEEMSGHQQNGNLMLQGPGTVVHRIGGRVQIHSEQTSPIEEIRGPIMLSAEVLDWQRIQVTVQSDDLSLRHPLVSSQPLPLGSVQVQLVKRHAEVSGTVMIGDVELAVEGRCDEFCSGTFRLEETRLSKALAPLLPLVPELGRARRVEGTVSGAVTLARNKESWALSDARISLQEVAVDGAIRNPDILRYGPFAYRVLGADGQPLVRESGEGSPDWVPLQRVSPWVIEAIIAAEDAGFRRHKGYDLVEIQEALLADMEAGAVVRGGSTLSQQLAKNLFLSGERTLVRKVRELLLAVEMDRVLGKSRILELYVNVVEWGPDIHGIQQASERYFLKQPLRLQPHEAAFLAAILPAPRTFYRRWYLSGKARRYKVGGVLTNMADLGSMSMRQAEKWARQPLRFVPPPR